MGQKSYVGLGELNSRASELGPFEQHLQQDRFLSTPALHGSWPLPLPPKLAG